MRAVIRILLLVPLCPLLCQCASTRPQGTGAGEQRGFIDGEANRILDQLEQRSQGARRELEQAEGYATFRYTTGKMPIILGGLGAGAGYGVAVDNADGQRTYMKVRKLNWGWGMGVKENATVFVFEDRAVFDRFRRGKWDSGAEAEATVKAGGVGADVGGTATVKKGFKAYTLTDTGLSYGITYQARRFSPIGSLNDRAR